MYICIYYTNDIFQSGFIDKIELEQALKTYNISESQIKDIIKEIDKNNDGIISFDEFNDAIVSGTVKKTALWGILNGDINVQKGAKAVLKRIENLKNLETENANENKDREEAIKNAYVGGSLLVFIASFRKFVLKI
jgi:hypothetical protein